MASNALRGLGAVTVVSARKESGAARFSQASVQTSSSSFSLNSKKIHSRSKILCAAASDTTGASEASEPIVQETSTFISDVANLIKLVDSRDIVELELKHKHYEILIRKKEALAPAPQTSFPGPHVLANTPWPQMPAPPPVAAPAPAVAEPAPVAAAPAVEAAAPPPADVPSGIPMKSPMAGTFYKCPAPGEPPFVKVGDRVQKGQVVCIIEAMKLMNEIEADQSGVITEILVSDGGAVSIDKPLFLISP